MKHIHNLRKKKKKMKLRKDSLQCKRCFEHVVLMMEDIYKQI